jgi:3-oxoacyl-[acyl-carrier protein] reductase
MSSEVNSVGKKRRTINEAAKIVVADLDDEGSRQTVNSITQQGGSSFFVHTDVTKAGDAENMIKATVDGYGKLDILFNNAGIGAAFRPVEETQEEFWDQMMAVNVKGPFLGCKYAIPVMKKQDHGAIIITASISGVRPRPGNVLYSISKAAAIMLTKALAAELAPWRIRVNCINQSSPIPLFSAKILMPDSWRKQRRPCSLPCP